MYDGKKQVIGAGIISQVVHTCGEDGDVYATTGSSWLFDAKDEFEALVKIR
jgi:hypothetical protein